jgi:outer membrane protein insertion porin family
MIFSENRCPLFGIMLWRRNFARKGRHLGMGLQLRAACLAMLALISVGLLGAGLCAGGALAQSPLAQLSAAPAIQVEGNHRIEASSIRSYFQLGPGGHFEATDLDTALKALYATNLFSDVHIARSGEGLIVTVKENPVIRRLALEGNRKLKEDQFKSELQSKSGGPLWRPIVQEDVRRIVELYHRRGYFAAKVEPKIINQPEAKVDLVFEISEGSRSGVKKIAFVGNHAFSTDRLKAAIKTGETNLLSFLLDNDLYDPDRIEADRDQLRRFYLKHGYADIHITAAQAEYDPAQNGFVVTFTIEEGNLYRVGKVDLRSSMHDLDLSLLHKRLQPASGDVFNAELVQKTVEDLTIEAARDGHPFLAVQAHDTRDPVRGAIDLTYEIEPGVRRYVERIDLHGNRKTKDAVIRREFEIAEGDAYNRALIARAERRLKNLGFFKTVKITDEPGSSPDRIILNVALEEQDTGDFNIMGGYSTTDGILGEVTLGERNLFGTGNAVRTSVTFGQYTKGFELGATQANFAGTGLAVGGDLFAKQDLANTNRSYGSEIYGTTFKLGTALNENLGTQFRYTIYNQRTSLSPNLMDCSPSNPPPGCYANGEASIPVKEAALAGPAWVSAVGSTVNYNTLDNLRSPTTGVSSILNQDLAGLGGDVKFLRTTEDFRAYHEVAGDVVGMVRAQGGYITPWGGQQVRLADSFFGGPQLVRGFAPNGFGPRDLTPGTTMDNVGGRQYWATSAELQTPAPLIPASSGLKLGFFTDMGSVWGFHGTGSTPALSQSLQVADGSAVRSSFGAGLIWDSPFGPIRADYAIPVSKTSYDITQRFNFSAGRF